MLLYFILDRHKDYKGPANVDITAPPFSYKYVGCFADGKNGATRDLKAAAVVVSSIVDCQDTCVDFSYFALQNGNQCRCGNTYNTNSNLHFQVADSECYGAVGYSMGGSNRNAICIFICLGT